ncbi:hypothetical protein [Nocardiopsis lambiniae]|uniref:Pyrrolo-quinoline quinone n=1 Tax=Nocardiopsis lambiniae TaxID=3075539 RepID=A0ABU2MD93_9ACTN|nr:hypothetical protein [Nocardiopsis sp. DSM 44743]MDT0330577.1 hypothetical protein [Nocardiopsis sp. DSM 44743]
MVEDRTIVEDARTTSSRGPLGWCGVGLVLGGATLSLAPGVPSWAGLSAAGAGVLLVVAGLRRMRSLPARRSLVPAAAGLACALIAGFGVRALTLSLAVEHTLAESVPDTAPPIPAEVTTTAWTRTLPGDDTLVRVVPGTLGPIVVLDDGVVALDGITGDELWRYRLRGADARATVYGGGTRIHIAHGDPDDPDRTGASTWVELDTARGGTVETFTVPPPPAGTTTTVLTVASGVLVHSRTEDDDTPRIVAHDTATLREAWSFTVPEEPGRVCAPWQGWNADNTLRTTDLFLLAYACVPEGRARDTDPARIADTPGAHLTGVVTALDRRDGRVRWTRELPGLEEFPALRVGGPVIDADTRPVIVVDPLMGEDAPVILDPRDGSHAVRITAEPWTDGRSVLVRADTGGAVVTETAADRLLVHRVSPEGGIVVTAALDAADLPGYGPASAVALSDAVVVPLSAPDADREVPAVWSVPFDGDPRFSVLDPVGEAGPLPLGSGADHHRAVAVPGALVTVARGAEAVRLHGLLP